MKLPAVVLFSLFLPVLAFGRGAKEEDLPSGLYAKIQSSVGTMIFRLDYQNTPLTVTNFCGLAEGSLPNDEKAPGEPYYDQLEFYRVVTGYVAYTGDPQNNGNGGPGYTFPREKGALISASSPGVLLMDGFPTESHGSRFLITSIGDSFLDNKYTPLGEIIQGSSVLKRIQQGHRIESITILRIGPEAQSLDFGKEAFDRLLAEAQVKEIEAFRADSPLLAEAVEALGPNKKKTPTGIYYQVTSPGEGRKPRLGDTVSVHYEGTLLDGTVFDSSLNRGQTFDFVLGRDAVIPSWVETVIDMQRGETRSILVPPSLAYGNQGFGPIPPDSWLQFEIQLVLISS